MSALDDFLARVFDDCVNARWTDPDIDICDLCGREDGDRWPVQTADGTAWTCEECR